jgi:hypothetical protein
MEPFMMTVGRLATKFQFSTFAALLVASALPSRAIAQDDHSHMMSPASHTATPQEKKQQNALVQEVRRVTAQFQHNPPADRGLVFGCVSGGDFGAMGLHFLKGSILNDGVVNIDDPEILLYEPLPNGKLELTGADYLVFKADWEAIPEHKGIQPSLSGQLFHLFDAPNRFGLPAFYTLHVWAWKDNPNGTFTNWNPDVSCDDFAGDLK